LQDKSSPNSKNATNRFDMTGISVIIPTYNRASFLGRALDSVCRQTMACDEIIVVDDGSSDTTYEIIDTFARECEVPVHYIFQENGGPARARNTGIGIAKFSHIAFLDSDDHWLKNKLKLQFDGLAGNPDMVISHTHERWYRRGIHLNQKKIHQPRSGNIFKHCLQLCAVGMSTVPEATVASAAGMKVAALSCITNMAAGISGPHLSHREVIAQTEKSAPVMSALVDAFLKRV